MSCPICENKLVPQNFFPSKIPLNYCERCGLLTQFPFFEAREQEQIYSKEYFNSWGVEEDVEISRVGKIKTFSRLLNKVERKIKPGGNLLDVGCATGYLLEIAVKRGWKPFGVEISKYAVEEARKKFNKESIFRGDLVDSPFRSHFFSIITMIDLIEHIPYPSKLLQKAHSLIKPGGILLIVTPSTTSISFRLMKKHWPHLKKEHLHYFSPTSMKYLLTKANFKILEGGFCLKSISLAYAIRISQKYSLSERNFLLSWAAKYIPLSVQKKIVFHLPLGEMFVLSVPNN